LFYILLILMFSQISNLKSQILVFLFKFTEND
jgi:hypothetical protein